MVEQSAAVGIIANPSSGKDIRRLVAFATTVDNQGKINIVRRALVGLGAAGIRHVFYMPDTHEICARALDGLAHMHSELPAARPLDMAINGRSEDSTFAASLLRGMGVGCIIVLGGDGTVRAVAKGCGEVPVLAVSTGTNNVLPGFIEGTVAGLAAGYVANGEVEREAVILRHKWLQVAVNGTEVDRALVDVAVLSGQFLGARAVWDTADLCQVIVTRADPATIGISAIAAMVRNVAPEEPYGLAIDIDPDAPTRVLAAYGPGLIGQVGIKAARLLSLGDTVILPEIRPLMLALDGEREQVLRHTDIGTVTLQTDGPLLVDSTRVMRLIAQQRTPGLAGML
ncbi:MAG: NAD(+)/NADH kinase [Chloroflexi bacterium]|nr:NAD(+)/NADH kinase [Chloroflexota bacterium]